jgi:hypothetical protein
VQYPPERMPLFQRDEKHVQTTTIHISEFLPLVRPFTALEAMNLWGRDPIPPFSWCVSSGFNSPLNWHILLVQFFDESNGRDLVHVLITSAVPCLQVEVSSLRSYLEVSK